jgi:hypothetical protein
MLDFAAVRSGERTMLELAEGLTVTDLHRLIDEMADLQLALVADAQDADVTFVPSDPNAKDTYAANESDVELAWTLGHVIVHATASSEEGAFLAVEMARGVPPHGRSRYETPWENITTITQARARLEESRRMIHAMLNICPDLPHVEVMTEPAAGSRFPAMNMYGRFLLGLMHADSHIEQLREILRQAHAARIATGN